MVGRRSAARTSVARLPAGTHSPRRAQPNTPRLVVTGRPALPLSPPPLQPGAASAVDVPVQAVAGSSGFWVGTGPGQRVFVLLEGGPVPAGVQPGARVSFTGVGIHPDASFAARAGLAPQEAAEAHASGVYLLVRAADLSVR